MIKAIFQYDFLENALLAGILASIVCGIIGVIITEKKLLMMSGGVAHTAYGGVGLGYLLGFDPMIGAGAFSVLSALIIGKISRKSSTKTDTVIALLWSLGMALGIAFTGLMPGYPPDINSYLFGNILAVSNKDIYVMLCLCVITIAVITVFWNDWKAFLFDSKFAAVLGINTAFLEYSLLILIALCIVCLIKIVGIILIIALLSAPAACASVLTKTLRSRLLLSVVFCLAFCITGLVISYYLGIPSGATIVFTAVLVYFSLHLFKKNK